MNNFEYMGMERFWVYLEVFHALANTVKEFYNISI